MTKPEPEEITCRPATWAYLCIFGFYDAFLMFAFVEIATEKNPQHPETTPASLWMLGTLIAALFLFTLWITMRTWRCRLRADAAGLHERDWRGRERFLPWEEVADYHGGQRLVTSRGSDASLGGTVVGKSGTRFIFKGIWGNSSLLAKRVRERATSAKAHDWAPLGARPQDNWPRTFHYQTRTNRVLPWIIVPLVFAGWVAATVAVYRACLWTVPLIGWGLTITSAACIGVCVGAFAILLCFGAIPDRLTRARMHQQITLTPEGVVFTDRTRAITADWEAITDARRARSRYLIQTDEGTFDFTPRIKDCDILTQALLYNAPRVRDWRLPEDDSALPTRHVTPSGVFVHHYRTRGNRGAIFILCTITLTLPLVLGLQWALGTLKEGSSFIVAQWCAVTVPILLWCWWRHQTARIERSVDGLTFHTPWGTRHLFWSQITNLRSWGDKKDRTYLVCSRRGHFLFFADSMTGISESERLVRAIEAHLSGKPPMAAETTKPFS